MSQLHIAIGKIQPALLHKAWLLCYPEPPGSHCISLICDTFLDPRAESVIRALQLGHRVSLTANQPHDLLPNYSLTRTYSCSVITASRLLSHLTARWPGNTSTTRPIDTGIVRILSFIENTCWSLLWTAHINDLGEMSMVNTDWAEPKQNHNIWLTSDSRMWLITSNIK